MSSRHALEKAASPDAQASPDPTTLEAELTEELETLEVEAAGIEPASVVAPVRTSTSVVRALTSNGGRGRTPYRRSSHP